MLSRVGWLQLNTIFSVVPMVTTTEDFSVFCTSFTITLILVVEGMQKLLSINSTIWSRTNRHEESKRFQHRLFMVFSVTNVIVPLSLL